MKKYIPLLIVIFFSTFKLNAQNIGINSTGAAPDASAILDVSANNKGMLVPRMTSARRIAIANPAKGLLVYDSTTTAFWFHNGSTWTQLSGAGNGWNITGNSGTNPADNFIGTTDNKPLRFRINNVWAGEINPISNNAFFGINAGNATGTGYYNTAIGDGALSLYSTGYQNTAIGAKALFNNTAGYNNTATGINTLSSNSTGSFNSANGSYALTANTTGNNNTANGSNALYYNTTGSFNTANGKGSLYTNSSGISNTATGYQALFSNTSGDGNTANGANALVSNIDGSNNTATGITALSLNTSGSNNTASGQAALYLNTAGSFNTANGNESLLSNTTGNNNTGNGYQALYFNTTGGLNTANGSSALYNNSTGSLNTASGSYSLYSNTTGSYNTAYGYNTLFSNTTGVFNTANGYSALSANETGVYNTANGFGALKDNITGYTNTALGASALYMNTIGNDNVAIGSFALGKLIGGSKNIAIGADAGTADGSPNVQNTISIGNDDILNGASNQVIIGNFSSTGYYTHNSWSTFSDARIKTNIKEEVKGLDFIMLLKPVTYNKSIKAMVSLTSNKETKDFPGKYDMEKIKYSGFLAQDVEQAAKETGYDFSGLHKPTNSKDLYALSYETFVVPLVKGMQEQQVIILKLQKQNELLEKRLSALEAKGDLR